MIRPFSFREVLRSRGEEPQYPPAQWTPALRSKVEERFTRYIWSGGFPEALRWLVRFVLRNPAGKMSVRKLNDDLRSQGHSVSRDTATTLLGHVVDAFLIDLVPLATESERQQDSNPRVVYPVDTGLIQAFDASGRWSRGHALETVVYNELARRGLNVGYYKSSAGHEVDFLARDYQGSDELIQVCADVSSTSTLERELRGLRAAAEDHPRARRTLLVLNRDSLGGVEEPGVRVLPAYEWLLGAGGAGGLEGLPLA